MLKNQKHGYMWGRKQQDSWDDETKFIYKVQSINELLARCKNLNLSEDAKNYAINRWLNFQSAKAVEYMFTSHSRVTAERNRFHQFIDFYVDGVNFDHKTSIFPKNFGYSLDYALSHKKELISWLYKNQSSERRQHFENRLFVVVVDTVKDEHWRLKSDLQELAVIINDYLDNFSLEDLIRFHKGDFLDDGSREVIYSDIIWYVK